jgi:ArsR family transcriptional regulator
MPEEKQNPACEDNKTVAHTREMMPDIELLYDLAELFKVLGDSTRVRILSALSLGELCVSDLADVLDMGQTAISHQLRLLRNARLVRARRDGKSIYYTFADDHVRQIFEKGFEHIEE